jgi:hypothetical protein
MEDEQQHGPNVRGGAATDNSGASSNVWLPEFWPHDPIMWFKQAEAAFRRGNVTDSLVKAVDDSTPDAFEQLKSRLVGSFWQSKWQQANAIIDHPGVGDTRPSALMNSMLSLLPEGEKPGRLFLVHFLQRLPAEIRNHLAGARCESPRDIAAHADVLWDTRVGAAMLAHVEYSSRGRSPQRRD